MKFNNPRAQRGLTFWYFIWQVVLFICLAYLLIIGIPPYLDNAKLKRALEALAEEPRVMQMSKPQMIKLLNRKLNIDIADDIVNLKQDMFTKRFKAEYGASKEPSQESQEALTH